MYKEIDPRVIENYLIENGQLEYAEHFSNLVDYLYELDKKLQSVKSETTPAELEAANHRIKELEEGLRELAKAINSGNSYGCAMHKANKLLTK